MKLTGAARFRTAWTGKVILQVQYFYLSSIHGDLKGNHGWRDAKLEDLKVLPQNVEVNRDV